MDDNCETSTVDVLHKGAKHIGLRPRSYQLELYEHAQSNNSILVLGTGSGKTFIGILLIRHFADQIRGKFSEGAKRTIMIANTVPLVRQQAEAIKKNTALKVMSFDGSMGVDYWTEGQWAEKLEEVEVLVLVAEIFKVMLLHGYISFSQVNLLIIDECHHAIGDHPMRQVMRQFAVAKENAPSELPRVLGLTASVIQKRVKSHEVHKVLKELECCLDSHLVTSSDYEEVLKYTTKPKEVLVGFNNNLSKLSQHGEEIKKMLEESAALVESNPRDSERIKKAKKLIKRVIRNIFLSIVDLGEWCASRAIEYEKETFKELVEDEKYVELEGVIRAVQKNLDEMNVKCVEFESKFPDIKDYVSHHTKRLLDILFKTRSGDLGEICGLIFVKTRFSAALLSKLLNYLAEDPAYRFLKSNFLVGCATSSNIGDLAGASKELKKQAKLLKEFRERKFNYLVCTSVLEEGLDVQSCNLVIRFDEPATFRSYVQGKGRARSGHSLYFLMYEEGVSKLHADVKMYHTLERELHSLCHKRELPLPEEVFASFEDDLLEPYAPFGQTGPKITSHSCLSVVANYCSRLPCDRFTTLSCSVKVYKERVDDKTCFSAKVTLPSSAAIKHSIKGDFMADKEWAKRSAMLKVCKALHEKGELSDRLLPFSKKSIEEIIAKTVGIDLSISTNISLNLHPKRICSSFSQAPTDMKFRLYIINIEQRSDKFRNVFKGNECLALLCSSKIYTCSFPLYHTRWIEANVSFEYTNTVIRLKPDQYQLIEHFTQLVFSFFLKIDKEFSILKADSNAADLKLFAAPIKDGKINVRLLSKMKNFDTLKPKKPSRQDQSLFTFNESDYENAVIIPWYKGLLNTPLYVQRVEEKTPLSQFENNSNETYKQYFTEKYNLEIYNNEQKLLTCSHISVEQNLLYRRVRFKPQSLTSYIPELCFLLPVSANLFYHMSCLSSIVYRLNVLNNAADFMINQLKIPISVSSTQAMNISWSKQCTDYLRRAHDTDNICVAFQQRDVITFNDYNQSLKMGSEKDSPVLLEFLERESSSFSKPENFMQTILCRNAKDYFDLERLEVLGDAFLKYHVSQVIYMAYPDWDEGKLSSLRCKLVNNAYLYKKGVAIGVDTIVTHTKFDPVQSGPAPGFVVNPEIEKTLEDIQLNYSMWHRYKPNMKTGKHKSNKLCYNCWTHAKFSDKHVADSMEAMLGWSLLTGSLCTAHRTLLNFGVDILHNPVTIPTTALRDTSALPDPEAAMETQRTELNKLYKRHCLDRLEKVLGYSFRDKSYLLQAVTHPSTKGNNITDVYQRLEFLGDAVLDFLITSYIYSVAEVEPGRMTDIRMYFVCNETLAKACVMKGLHKFILEACSSLTKAIDMYVTSIEVDEVSSNSGSSTDDDDDDEYTFEAHAPKTARNTEFDEVFSVEDVEVPKVLGDVVESIIGAVYLDTGFSLAATWAVLKTLMPEIVSDDSFSSVEIDCVRELYEMCSEMKIKLEMEYIAPKIAKQKCTVKLKVPGLPEITGKGKNKRLAKWSAFRLALKKIKAKLPNLS